MSEGRRRKSILCLCPVGSTTGQYELALITNQHEHVASTGYHCRKWVIGLNSVTIVSKIKT